MLGTLRRIGHKHLFVVGRGIPKDSRDVPRAIAIVNNQTVTLSLEFAMSAKQGFRRWPLKEGACLGVYGCTQKIIGSCVADVELDR
jgi:hypothetical protein